ncbi:MAG TPA: AAA family ATPase, partial [Anaerolineales bacterium]|nr:AAA family ATPase [Anaerolineales bacterium]
MPLRLKSLELHGYKTFATRTLFEFAPGITAVVGPNGAGKSNVADALRWVLGEQSYSLLRGKKTEDMIFSGSEHRPRAGMASAEVSFDNTARWLPVDYSEVGMTRRAYRDGHNDYLLNGQHVRLRDMNELLAAAGLSERTYTMVGQGLVDASLALKADERRRLFEEAAGVGLYRVRREEALRRLETTRRNLERVQDVLSEIEPRLKTLERQARRAKEYSGAQADLREVLREWYGYHWHRAQQELQQARGNIEAHQGKAVTAHSDLEQLQEQRGRLRDQLAGLRVQLGAWHRESAASHQERETVSVALAVLDERRRTLETSIAAMEAQLRALADEQLVAGERRAQLDQEMARAEAEEVDAATQAASAQDSLRALQSGRGALESDLQQAQGQLAALNANRAQSQARLDALAIQLARQDAAIQAATQSSNSAEETLAANEASLRDLADKTAATARVLEDAQVRTEAARQAVAAREDEWGSAVAERTSLLANQSRLQAQLEVLEQAEQMLAGYAEGARFLLDPSRSSQLRVHGALSGILQFPAELETAITAALGDAVDSVLIDAGQIEKALDLLDSQDAGRAMILPLAARAPQAMDAAADGDVLGVAARLVQAPAHLRLTVDALLGNTLLVRSRSSALRLRASLPLNARVVTLQGEVYRGDGLITAGKLPVSAILSRPRQKRELASALADMGKRLDRLEARIEASLKAAQAAK